jgi:hypothetical protein
MKKWLYGIAVLLNLMLLLGTAGASDRGNLTTFETFWQVIIALAGILWWSNLVRIENERERRKIYET